MSIQAPLTPAPEAILSPAPAPTIRLLLLFFIAILIPTSRGEEMAKKKITTSFFIIGRPSYAILTSSVLLTYLNAMRDFAYTYHGLPLP